ncbi:IclR family transcriptional regulator [Bordetella sp. BOR01]|uniref:IclR family transcriptional regulator n=1 Tax=Bordetella sp. BOR01 TaxID=2854779 RepID=UPI001C459DA0|nr:IclR family transcriptional regulator [Bordetella sp. BOR01]MBV7486365.1 IclR family transcriptional regulator [Bordetella sp. BOR01]
MNDQVKSASRVLDILELFSSITDPMGVSDVAKRLNLPKSSAQALLLTLAARGYLVRQGADYLLPPELKGGWVGGMRTRLQGIAGPVMERAAQESGESLFLGMLAPTGQVQYLAKTVSAQEIRYDAALQPLRPAHCTSMGLVMLAYAPGYEPGDTAFQAHTPHTITDPAKIARLLADARRDGYAEVLDGHVEGASGVSAPIFDSGEAVVAALNIGAPTWRYERNRKLLIDIVCREARAVTALLRGTAA